MAGSLRRRWLLLAVAVLAIAAGGTATAATASNPDVVPTVADGNETTTASNVDATLFASCTASPTTVTVGETVTLDATSSDADFVEFDKFGDSNYPLSDDDGDFIVNVSYAEPGTYEPWVRADGDSADTDSCGSVEVVQNQSPNASFTTRPQPGIVDEPIEFDASNSTDPDGEIVRYNWDFNGDEQFEVTTTEPTVNHTYTEIGTYQPILRVDDEERASGYDSRDVEVVERQNEPPSASFTYSPEPGIAGQAIEFDASNSVDPDGNVSTYRWDFDGDEQFEETTTEPTANWTYFSSGFENVILQVEDDENATAFTSRDVEVVEANVVARCSVEPTTATVGETVLIDARASENGSYLDYNADGVGEYDVYETQNFTLEWSYDEPGTYTPIVRVYGAGETDVEECGTIEVEPENEPPEASFTYDPQPGIAGQPITFDASASSDPDGQIEFYDWDVDGDGVYEETTTDPVIEETFFDSGFENVALRVRDDLNATGFTSRDVEIVEPSLRVECTVEPGTVAPGEEVTIQVGDSENVSYMDYDYDGDGEFDRFETRERSMTTSYDEPGTYTPLVRVYSGTGSQQIVECDPVTVEEPNEPPNAAFTPDPNDPEPGETVTFDGSNSSDPDGNIVTYSWDFDGDGVIDQNTSGPIVNHTYNDTGAVVPRLVVVDDDGATDETEREISVEASPDEEGIPPWWPIPAIGIGILGLGGLAYYILGGGGAAGGGKPKPKPKPRPHGTQEGARYETGVFELPTESGPLSVPVGFEPDLILFSAANGARTDTATDRTAGWTRGIAHRTADGVQNQCLTVADDAHATDQATCAFDDELAVQLVRHEAEGPPGRVTARVTQTTGDGFDLDVSVPGDDPLAGGIRVLYQAFRTGAQADVEAGTVMTPTEPGTQTVELGLEADHVSFSVGAAVSDTDQLWTTDRGVGVSVGHATAEPEAPISQGVAGTSAWPGTGHPVAGVGDDASMLHLLYQDGDQLAGRTSAAATAMGETLRLQYDRVYNGPHKLGSTARHPISYLALAGGDTMRPAVGTFSLPRPGENLTVECGFEPALIELRIAPAPLGEEIASGATPHPFGWSQGTAIVTGDRLRQYVLHHAVVPEQPEMDLRGSATDATGAGTARASTDGGRVGEDPTVGAGSVPDLDVQPRGSETPAASKADEETRTAPAAPEHEDDGRAGLWLATDPDGTVVGRDELRVAGITETGFQARVESIDTDRRTGTGRRPTVVYRAWPAVDVTGSAGERSPTSEEAASDAESATSDRPSQADDAEPGSADVQSPSGGVEPGSTAVQSPSGNVEPGSADVQSPTEDLEGASADLQAQTDQVRKER